MQDHAPTRSLWTHLALIVLFAALLATAQTLLSAAPVMAQQDVGSCFPSPVNCQSNDVELAQLVVRDVIDPCIVAGDTAQVQFQAQFDPNASDRYDVGLFLNLLGGSSVQPPAATNSCLRAYLSPNAPLNSNAVNVSSGTGPFRNFDSDACGDIRENDGITRYNLQTVTITCKDSDNNGVVDPINYLLTWSQGADTIVCNSTNDLRPGTNPKCRHLDVPINLQIGPRDLGITKSADKSFALPGEFIQYTLVVRNWPVGNPPLSRPATGVVVSDTLNSLLVDTSVVSTSQGSCTIVNNLLTCNLGTMAPNGTATIVVKGKVDPNQNIVAHFTNTVCVEGFEPEPTPDPHPNCDTVVTLTPVTLAYFQATRNGDVTHFEWNTATETDNAGFELYAQQGNERVKLGPDLIPSKAINTFEPQDYALDLTGIQATEFYLYDLDTMGNSREHGPFLLGEPMGQKATVEPIDWTAVNAEHEAKAQTRAAQNATAVNAELASVAMAGAASTVDMTLREQTAFVEGNAGQTPAAVNATPRAYMPLLQLGAASSEGTQPTNPNKPGEPNQPGSPTQPSDPTQPGDPTQPSDPNQPSEPTQPSDPNQPSEPTQPSDPNQPGNPGQPSEPTVPTVPTGSTTAQVNFGVRTTGLYRVTFEDLTAAGIDYSGVRSADLALTNRGQAVPMRVISGDLFGPGAYIEFYGKALDTLYTDNNIYVLEVNTALALRIGVNTMDPAGDATAAVYAERSVFDDDRAYMSTSPGAEPWFNVELYSPYGASTQDVKFSVDGYVAGAGAAQVEIEMWGGSRFASDNDHHVLVSLNGQPIANEYFDGYNIHTFTVTLPDGLLLNGENTLTLSAPRDNGVRWDIMQLDRYTVTYPRAFVARNNALTFDAAGSVLRVDGLTSPEVIAYRSDAAGLVRLDKIVVEPSNGGYAAKFVGSAQPATYYVATAASLLKPSIAATPTVPDLLSTPATFLMISHPSFIDDLASLVAARTAQGYTVRVVDVNDLYDRYSYGIVDPAAIKAYIKDAAAQMGTKYVLLVGGDTYDYRNRTNSGSISFIPSLWMATGDITRWTAVDPLYVDVDDNYVPDLAIGRFPVRTSAELQTAIAKTQVYQSATDYARNAVFTAGPVDGPLAFTAQSEAMISSLGAGWTVNPAYVDTLGVAGAKTALIDGINSGAGLVNFVGHSSPTKWATSLFNSTEAANLANTGKPTVVLQWGCWNTYYADPKMNTLGHMFMLSGDRGAAAVLGSTSLAGSDAGTKLGPLVLERIAQPGMTLGDAVLQGKQQLAQSNPSRLDLLLAWTILGDPTVVVTR